VRHGHPPQGAIYHGIRRGRFRLMTYEQALKVKASPRVLANAQQVLDGAARRLLDERLEVEALGATAGKHPHDSERAAHEITPLVDGQVIPPAHVDGVSLADAA
jgi:hypothetical protein